MTTETTLTADTPAAASTPPAWAEIGDILRRHVETAGELIAPVVIAEDDNPDLWDEEPHNPQRLARLYRESVSPSEDGPLRLRHWCGDFYQSRDGQYHLIDGEVMENQLRVFIDAEYERVYRLRMAIYKLKADQGVKRPKKDRITCPLVRDVFKFFAALCSRETAGLPSLPAWLGETAGGRPPAREMFAFPNGLLHATTGEWVEPTPEFFNLNSLGFEYDADAPTPVEWLKFLASVWPHDPASIDSLQEWFGYLLTGDNRYQKALWIKGMSRGGKGVILQNLRDMLGEMSVACPTLQQLGERYGLHVLVDSPVAWIDEPKVGKNDPVANIVNTIKRITGGSPVDIDRKHKPTIKGKRLTTRFVVTSNELLQLDDASGVIAGRFVVLTVPRSHVGSEDTGLVDRIRPELPGILLWALAGLRRLHARGRFLQTATGREELDQLRELASPITQFVGDKLVVDPDADVFTPAALVYSTWREWCLANGETPGPANAMSAKLNSILPATCKGRQGRIGGEKMRYFPGVRLRGNHELDNDSPGDDGPREDRDSEKEDRDRDRDNNEKQEHTKDTENRELLNGCTQKAVPIPPVSRSLSRSAEDDRDTASACQDSDCVTLSLCPDESRKIHYFSDSPVEQAPTGGSALHAPEVQPAMGNHRDIGTETSPADHSGPPLILAELVRFRSDFARLLRSAGLTWEALRERPDVVQAFDDAGAYLPLRLADLLPADCGRLAALVTV